MKKEADSFTRFLIILYGTTLLLLVVFAWVIQKGEEVYWINGNHTPLLDTFFSIITYLGDGLVFVPPLVILLFIKYRYVIILTCAWAGHGIISHVLKRWIFYDSPRPRALLDNDLLYFVRGVKVNDQFSFPSGHTITIFCLTVLLSLMSRSKVLSLVMVIVALLVGYSRIYLLQHFLADVAAGAVVGSLTSLLCWYLFHRYQKSVWIDSKLDWPIKR